ncbi:hypothetical protein RRG08_052477 [Elysia crispata]|uniref:G-protein coupled receptors family 1 profile domain-containing protein n=1 Tax=Elysia crispata TaxID=231223 RepID=A0AAE1E9I1_9GAST|nr:hypothetical protein RRG08_052477 [Elysia crispata]
MIRNLSVMEENTTSRVWPHLHDWPDPTMEPAKNRTEFYSMTAVGINTVVAAAVLANNTLLLVTLARTRKLWNSTNAYIASLAAADLLVGIMMVVRNFWIIPETAWVFHNYQYVCMPIVCLLYVSCLESITCLALVSLDRYTYIVYPFWYERHVNKRFTTTSIALSWVMCIAFGFLPMRLNKFSVESGCDPLSIISREYLLYGLNLYLFGAEVLIAAMYGRIYCVGNQQRKKIEASTGGIVRQRLNSKASKEFLRNDVGGDGSVDGEKRGSMEPTVAVIDLAWKDDRARFEGDNDKGRINGDLKVSNGLGCSTVTYDDYREISYRDMESEVGGGGKDIQTNTSKPEKEKHMMQTAKTTAGTESGEDGRKRSILERVINLRKLKKISLSSTRDSIASRWQVIRFLILVCGIFFLCWTPLQIISIFYFTVGTPIIAISVAISFAAVNSALNIYILIAMNKTFKAALLKMICPTSCEGRVGKSCRWRKEDKEFVSDFNPPPRASLQGIDGAASENGSLYRENSLTMINGIPHRLDSVDVVDGSLHVVDSVAVRNGSLYSMDPKIVEDESPHRENILARENESFHREDSLPVGDTSSHPVESVAVVDESPIHIDSGAVENGCPPREESAAVTDVSPQLMNSENKGEKTWSKSTRPNSLENSGFTSSQVSKEHDTV